MNLPILLEHAPRLGARIGADLWLCRDDLIPFSGGGNKVRKMARIVAEAEAQGCNALVTSGGVQSNHARVTALMAAERGWACTLVLHGEPGALRAPTGNLLLCILAGARVQIVAADGIGPGMDQAMADLSAEGRRPYYVWGGGHSLAGTLAYADAVRDLAATGCTPPDVIIHASGTGATQAGIIVGVEREGWSTRVVGISVARRNPRGARVVEQSRDELREALGLASPPPAVEFRDEWVGGGYGEAGAKVWQTIHMAAREAGLVLDPTYTGKAFTGLVDMLLAGEISPSARVLFWHTGGLLNLMASDSVEGVSVAL